MKVVFLFAALAAGLSAPAAAGELFGGHHFTEQQLFGVYQVAFVVTDDQEHPVCCLGHARIIP